MKRAAFGLISAAVIVFAASPAAADDYGHIGQFGLRAGLVAGYRMVFRYDSSPYCRTPDPTQTTPPKVCGHAAPLASDFGLSFSLLDFFEPYVWARLGLEAEEQTNTEPVQIIGVGARLYTMSDSAFKIFLDPAVAYEFEGGGDNPAYAGNNPDYSKDIVLHFAAGPQLDLHQNFGVFLDGGVTTGIVRAIHSELELQLGIQGRLP